MLYRCTPTCISIKSLQVHTVRGYGTARLETGVGGGRHLSVCDFYVIIMYHSVLKKNKHDREYERKKRKKEGREERLLKNSQVQPVPDFTLPGHSLFMRLWVPCIFRNPSNPAGSRNSGQDERKMQQTLAQSPAGSANPPVPELSCRRVEDRPSLLRSSGTPEVKTTRHTYLCLLYKATFTW